MYVQTTIENKDWNDAVSIAMIRYVNLLKNNVWRKKTDENTTANTLVFYWEIVMMIGKPIMG